MLPTRGIYCTRPGLSTRLISESIIRSFDHPSATESEGGALCQSVPYFSKQPSTLKQLIFLRQRLTRLGTSSSHLATRSQMMLVRLRRERYSPSDLLRQPRTAIETLIA